MIIRRSRSSRRTVPTKRSAIAFARGARTGQVDRLLDDGGDPLAIDVLHREDVHARIAHRDLLALVEVADADEDGSDAVDGSESTKWVSGNFGLTIHCSALRDISAPATAG